MASHHYHHHPHQHHQPAPPPPPPPPSTHCCCYNNPPHPCYTTPPPLPPPQDHYQHLAQPIPTTTHHPHYPKPHNLLPPQTHSTISSLLHRIESLESSLITHHNSRSSSFSLRLTAARVIQTHFRSFLARRSRTLRHLKHLALIKSTFNSLKSSLSLNTHHDFAALSRKGFNLLIQLDSIEGFDPMIVDGKRSISRDLVQFLDSIEGVAVKKHHMRSVKVAKNARLGHRVNKSRDSGGDDDDERRKMLQNLRGRVERISRLCSKVSENGEDDLDPEGVHHVGNGDYDGDDGVADVLIRRNEVSKKKNGVFVQRQGVQPRVKKSVTFAENGKIYEVYGGGGAYEPDLIGDATCLDGSSSSDDQRDVMENADCAVEDDVVDSSQSAEDDEEEAVVVESDGSPHSSNDGGRNPRSVVEGRLQGHQERILFSAPVPVKMENKAELMKSKGVRILT